MHVGQKLANATVMLIPFNSHRCVIGLAWAVSTPRISNEQHPFEIPGTEYLSAHTFERGG